jgi:predicted membrane metal-binding protein
VLGLVLQIGMLPPMARDFHRIPPLGPVVNLLVVPLMGVIVPLGFIGHKTLPSHFMFVASSLVMRGLGRIVAAPLAWLVGIPDAIVVGRLREFRRGATAFRRCRYGWWRCFLRRAYCCRRVFE